MIIHKLTFNNFYSFEEEYTINFSDIEKSAETQTHLFTDSPSGTRLSKIEILVGANASGKTNALKAFIFLFWFASNSFQKLKPDDEIPIEPFLFSDDSKQQPSNFELTFEHEKTIYRYNLCILKSHVISEALYQKSEDRNRFRYIFKRNDKNKSQLSISSEFGLNKTIIQKVLRKNASLLSTKEVLKNHVLSDIVSFFSDSLRRIWRIATDREVNCSCFKLILRYAVETLKHGGIIVISELGYNIHPYFLPIILDLFANPEKNTKNAQLLFTTHCMEVLKHVEKEQVILVEKDSRCRSRLYRLDQLKGVRRDDNIYEKYMAGAYGAVPNI